MFITNNFGNYDLKAPNPLYGLKLFMPFACHSHVICMSLVCARMSSVCHSHLLICHPYITGMYLYAILMSLLCTCIPSVFQSYVFVCHPYVTRMHSYFIHMSLACTRKSSVCHSYVVLPWTVLRRAFAVKITPTRIKS